MRTIDIRRLMLLWVCLLALYLGHTAWGLAQLVLGAR